MRNNGKWIALIVLATLLFFWKLVFTHQFSMLVQQEQANQAYAWYHFAASCVQQGTVPLWDPYTNAGRTFVGGMETGVFYPPKLLLYLWPFNRSGLLSPQLFHYYYVLAHVLASCFLFLLALELGLSRYAALLASLCFSLGGIMARVPWPDMVDSGVWLPLILLFLLRSLKAPSRAGAIRYACFAGLALGMAILAGRIHIVMMDVIVIVTAALWFASRQRGAGTPWYRGWARPASIIAVIGIFAGLLGAVQLFPSVEYSRLAVRHIGAPAPVGATDKILYTDLHDEFRARAILSLLFPQQSGGQIGGEGLPIYFGVMPLLLAALGAWRNWEHAWVRYLAFLALAAFLFTLGPLSLLHGLAYALVPFLWMARGSARFIYLTHFAFALLAGFGMNWIMARRTTDDRLNAFVRVFTWGTVALVAGLTFPALYGTPDVNDWIYFSLIVIVASCGLLAYLCRSGVTRPVQVLLIALILCDLYAFDWLIQDRTRVQRTATDHLERLLRTRDLANFLKGNAGLFRVSMDMNEPPNIGDLYGIQTTGANMATEMRDFLNFRTTVPRARDLLNVRYTVKPGSAGEPGSVWSSAEWKVYENPRYCPRAWVVHRVTMEPSGGRVLERLREPSFDPLSEAIVAGTLAPRVEPARPSSPSRVSFVHYRPAFIEMSVETAAAGLLVVSEMDFPGWKAYVNGRPVAIHKVDAVLRGVELPAGINTVVMRYRPASVIAGAVLSLAGLIGAAILAKLT